MAAGFITASLSAETFSASAPRPNINNCWNRGSVYMTQMTFKEWWIDQPSIDYDEMCVASDAWDYQQHRIDDLESQLTTANARVEALEATIAKVKRIASAEPKDKAILAALEGGEV